MQDEILSDYFDKERVCQKVKQAAEKYERRYLYRFIKRAFDIVSSFCALIVLSPIFLCTALLIKIEDRGPIFYSQTRVTYGLREFQMYKFRSMRVDADKMLDQVINMNESDGPQFKIKDDPRITKIGKIIRKTSIDELPQLWNVLRGDISIVGPRPNQSRIVEQYSSYEKQRFLVRGGLASYRECNGRSRLSFEEWIAFDLKYVCDCSFTTDLKIIIKTIKAIITRDGAS